MSQHPHIVLPRYALALLLVAFVCLATVYNVVNPVFEAPDEIQHFYYVRWLAEGHGLPVQGAEGEGHWAQEGGQPPLYYALGALATFWLDTGDLPEVLRYNPHANVGNPLGDGNKNRIVHTPGEQFPYRGTVLAVHLLRFLSTLLGAGTVLATCKIGTTLFHNRPFLALAAGAVNAFIPQFLFVSAAVSNDSAVTLLASWSLLLLLRMMVMGGPEPSWRGDLALGVLIGLACLSKASAVGLIPLAVLALIATGWRERSAAVAVRRGGIILGTAVLVAGWWYWRNLQLYGDPLGLQAILEVAGYRPEAPTLGEIAAEFQGLRISLWGIFGWFNVLLPAPVYGLLDGLTIISAVGVVAYIARAWQRRESGLPEVACIGLLLAWLIVLGAALIRWTMLTPGTQGRLLFPGISGISALFVLGLAQFVPDRRQAGLVWAVNGALLALAIALPFLVIAPAYARPETLSAGGELPPRVRQLDVVYGDQARLAGYEVTDKAYAPGERVPIRLYWQGLRPMTRDYSVFVHLVDPVGAIVAQEDTLHGHGNFPTSQWRPGETLLETYLPQIVVTALAPTELQVEVGLYDYATGRRLPVSDYQGKLTGDAVRFAHLSLAPTTRDSFHAFRLLFGDEIALTGYDISDRVLAPGNVLKLELNWQALTKIARDYTVFVHLVTSDGRWAGQQDGQPGEGRNPTSSWVPGQEVRDQHRLSISAVAPAGLYDVVVGVYYQPSGRRLPVRVNDFPGTAEQVTLTQIKIIPR
jgi:hypothetical protein